MTCEDCIHQKLCYANCDEQFDRDDNTCFYCKAVSCPEKLECKYFKDKSRFVELPCEIGERVFRVLYINTPDDEYYMSFSKEWMIRQGNFTLNDLSHFGKTVFLAREEAEKALKECEKND